MSGGKDPDNELRQIAVKELAIYNFKIIDWYAGLETMLINLQNNEFRTELLSITDPGDLLPKSRVHISGIIKDDISEISFFSNCFFTMQGIILEVFEIYEMTTTIKDRKAILKKVDEYQKNLKNIFNKILKKYWSYLMSFVPK